MAKSTRKNTSGAPQSNPATANATPIPEAAKGSRISRFAIIGFAFAVVATIAALGAAVFFTRDTFDMKKKLVEIRDTEGVWDNPWDKVNEKIASVKTLIA